MEIFFLFYIFIVGLVFGSFYNVVILRPFSNESIVMPPSKCPKCNHRLAWYDNIPVLSYLMLRAKCRYCKEPIHWQYPLVELTTGILFVCAYIKFGLTWQLLFMLIALSFFVIMSGTDFKEQVVFDMHTVPFIICGVIYGLVTKNSFDSGVGMILGLVIMESLRGFGYLIARKPSFGVGDTYIAVGIGAFLGVKGIILTIIFSVFIQTFWVLPILLIKYIKNKKYSELISILIFIAIIACYCILKDYNALSSTPLFLFYVILMVIFAIKVCKELLASIQLPGGGTYLPFGPALFAGAAIMIFFGDQIYNFLKNIDLLANVVI